VRSAHIAAQRDEEHTFALAGAEIVADPSGALYWPDERMLVVADLHLEKGSAFAKRGVLLPPYDTASTLARLAVVKAVAESDD
jgi:metallophosphoesterase superfamily enzyme